VTDGKIKLKATKLPDEIAIQCTVCSRISERPLMAAEGKDIVICPHCLAEGDIDAELERNAARFESRSRWLRALIGRLEVPPPAVLKEFARPEDIEQAAVFWGSLSDLLDEGGLLPINQAAHRLASLLQEYRGLWPLIKSDAEADTERAKALEAALTIRRQCFGPGAGGARGRQLGRGRSDDGEQPKRTSVRDRLRRKRRKKVGANRARKTRAERRATRRC
jgi:hypothetical protein